MWFQFTKRHKSSVSHTQNEWDFHFVIAVIQSDHSVTIDITYRWYVSDNRGCWIMCYVILHSIYLHIRAWGMGENKINLLLVATAHNASITWYLWIIITVSLHCLPTQWPFVGHGNEFQVYSLANLWNLVIRLEHFCYWKANGGQCIFISIWNLWQTNKTHTHYFFRWLLQIM